MKLIDKIPSEIADILETRGVPKTEPCLCVRSDIDANNDYADSFIVLSRRALHIIEGLFVRNEAADKKGFKARLNLEFRMNEYHEYEIEKVKNIKSEQLISTGLLTAEVDGEKTALCYYTNFRQYNMDMFAKIAGKILAGEEVSDGDFDDDENLFCPKCKARYPDLERKICPRCMEAGSITKRIMFFFKRYKGYLAALLIAAFFASALLILIPVLVGEGLFGDVLTPGGKMYGEILLFAGVMLGTRLIRAFFMMIQGLLNAKIGARVVHDIKTLTFESMQKLSLGFFASRQTGGLMTRINNDANILYWFFVDGFPWLIMTSLQMIGLLTIMFLICWWLTLIILGILILGFVVLVFINKVYEILNTKAYSKQNMLNMALTDSLEGKTTIKVFGKENKENSNFAEKNKGVQKAGLNINRAGATFYPALLFVVGLSTFIAWGFGGWQVIQGNMNFGSFVTYTMLLGMVMGPLDFLSEIGQWWSDCINSAQRIFEILDSTPTVVEAENPIDREPDGKIEFRNVNFYYQKNKDILKDVSFTLEAGKALGIVGKSGAGKSTLANLVTRLYDATAGEIFIDGEPIKNYSLDCIHKNTAIVSQEIYLFNGSVAENIKYGNDAATREEVIAAAKAASAHDFIMMLPDGYETYIGSNREFSGGEKQRISIARAVLRNPKILVLDEATAAMDTQTEQNIQIALNKLMKGATTIIIAHRLSTLRDVDSLMVMEDGRITERGTHKELMNLGGTYAKLFDLQMLAAANIIEEDNIKSGGDAPAGK